jgi:DNA polymerase-3 subunit delta
MNELRSAVVTDEAFALFNYASYDGADINFGEVAEHIKSPPMMGEYKLIEWRFANLDGLKENEKSALFDLFSLKEDYPCAIFAIMTTEEGFDAGTPKRPSKLASKLKEGFDIIDFPKSTDAQHTSWLKKHFDAEGVAVTPEVCEALLFRSGHSMEVLNNEVLKLSAFALANGRNSLTVRDVEEVASPTAECDAFALSNAVIEKNIDKAFFALTDLKARRVEPPVIIAMLERVYADLASVALLLDEGRGSSDVEAILKIHPFKAKLYINAAKKIGSKGLAASLSELCRLDASSKSGGVSGYGAIEMFVTNNL